MTPEIDKLKLIKEVIGEAIELVQSSVWTAKNFVINGPVNWADLSCVEVAYCLSDDGQEYHSVLIKEADPINDALRIFVASYMLTQNKVLIDRELIIRTDR